ncbi:MAG: hypothetical protein LBS74_10700 [Oscillospiraceae bacterium]|jgi:hypothetical protein|nr:hypothetical protein [Oscillospiraceae bacterium]
MKAADSIDRSNNKEAVTIKTFANLLRLFLIRNQATPEHTTDIMPKIAKQVFATISGTSSLTALVTDKNKTMNMTADNNIPPQYFLSNF